MMTKAVKDTLTGKTYQFTVKNEDEMWGILCDEFGTGYVFENFEEI